MPTTSDIVDQHLKCFGERDLDGVLADYSSDAVLFIPGQPLKGLGEIKPFFQALLSEFGKPGAEFSMRQQCVDGEYAYISWGAETADNSYEAATDAFVVHTGRSWRSPLLPRSPRRAEPAIQNTTTEIQSGVSGE